MATARELDLQPGEVIVTAKNTYKEMYHTLTLRDFFGKPTGEVKEVVGIIGTGVVMGAGAKVKVLDRDRGEVLMEYLDDYDDGFTSHKKGHQDWVHQGYAGFSRLGENSSNCA